mmetsp:Transcript_20416/g.44514  ORF Transcript_20416/g.44514 Transcript_20416/m.44514 type:complete len:208 (-) Transcript_20416:421-1044(-)
MREASCHFSGRLGCSATGGLVDFEAALGARLGVQVQGPVGEGVFRPKLRDAHHVAERSALVEPGDVVRPELLVVLGARAVAHLHAERLTRARLPVGQAPGIEIQPCLLGHRLQTVLVHELEGRHADHEAHPPLLPWPPQLVPTDVGVPIALHLGHGVGSEEAPPAALAGEHAHPPTVEAQSLPSASCSVHGYQGLLRRRDGSQHAGH